MTDDIKRPKRTRAANQLAKFTVDNSTMDKDELKAHRERLSTENQKPGNLGSSPKDLGKSEGT